MKVVKAAGLYHPLWNNNAAWIEIFVDNALVSWRKGRFWRLFPRDLSLSDVVFHEIGHHIHFAIKPEYKEREDVADVWKVKLSRNYTRIQHPLLRFCFRVARLLLGPIYRTIYKRTMKYSLERRWMSRAEYEESMK